MKKSILILCSLLLLFVFSGCSNNTSGNVSSDLNSVSSDVPSASVPAKTISEEEASLIIQEYPLGELKLGGNKDDYSFLVSTEKEDIEGIQYYQVIASIVNKEKDGKKVSIDQKATFYVSADGEKALRIDKETGEKVELKK